MNSGNVMLKDLRSTYQEIRTTLSTGSGKKRLTRKHEVLIDVVTDLGGGPADGEKSKTFWDRVKNEYNGRVKSQDIYKNWDGPRKAFERLQVRMGDQGLMNRRGEK